MVEFLVEKASEDYDPIDFDFSNEDLMAISHDEEKSLEKTCWKLYFDGTFNALENSKQKKLSSGFFRKFKNFISVLFTFCFIKNSFIFFSLKKKSQNNFSKLKFH